MLRSLKELAASYPKSEATLKYFSKQPLETYGFAEFLCLTNQVGLSIECVDTSLDDLSDEEQVRLVRILLKALNDRLKEGNDLVGPPYKLESPMPFYLFPHCKLIFAEAVLVASRENPQSAKAQWN